MKRTPQQKPKPGGITYTITTAVGLPHLHLAPGCTLAECHDGWYQAFYPTGLKHFLRISPEILNENLLHLKKI